MRSLGEAKMNPHPHVAQHQGDAHEQQTQPRIVRTRFDLRLVHLAIARFNAETLAIGLPYLLGRSTYLRHHVEKPLATPSAGLFVGEIPAGDANVHGHAGFRLFFRWTRGNCLPIVTIFLLQQRSQAVRRRFRVLGLSASHDGGNDESTTGAKKIRDHFHAEKALVQQQKRIFTPRRRTIANNR